MPGDKPNHTSSADALEDDFPQIPFSRPTRSFPSDASGLHKRKRRDSQSGSKKKATLAISADSSEALTDSGDGNSLLSGDTSTKNARKKKKKRKSADARTIGGFDGESQAAFYAQMQRAGLSDLTSLELESKRLQSEAFIDTSKFKDDRLQLENLPRFITSIDPDTKLWVKFGGKKPTLNGSPIMLIVTSAALRATAVIRTLRTLNSDNSSLPIAKLFGKHFKLAEQDSFLQRHFINVAVGTPARILKLVAESESLNLVRLRFVIVDATWRDDKQRTIFGVPECRTDLARLLATDEILMRLQTGETRIAFY